MPARPTLTARQTTFAHTLASGSLSATEAARRAGYRHPDRLGPRLQKVAGIQALIAEIRSNVRDPAQALEEHLQQLEAIRDQALATNNFLAALKTQVAIGRALGLLGGGMPAAHPAPALCQAELAQRIVGRLAATGLALVPYDNG